MLRTLFSAVLLASALGWAQPATGEVSFVNEGIIPAPVAEVWKVFSTSEGYKAVGVSLASVDLKIGGTIRSRYKADGKLGDEESIENVILAYEPLRMIATRIQKPPKSFPFQQAWKQTWTVVTLSETLQGQTLLRATSLGYGTDEESLAMRRFFERGNQQTIESLQKYFTRKP